MSLEIFKQIKSDIDERKMWEDRQATAYKLRFGQVKRRSKPFKNAADFTWPLVDMYMEKQKPAYVEQVMGPELIASFLSTNPQGDGFKHAVAQWFDYRVKHKSNFKKAILHVIDQHMQCGKGFLKTYWDCNLNRVRHQMIPGPLFVVPPWTEEIDDEYSKADRACHILHMSTLTYKRVGEKLGYNMDEDFMASISGRGEEKMYEQAKELKEGIAYHKKQDMIILWEVYERLPSEKIKVHTFSPMQPEEQVRADFMFPYNHGRIPVVSYDFEVTDPGFYSTRGVGEILALPQSILKMLLDMQMDYMIMCNRPVWKPGPNNPPVNYENLEVIPGQVINADIVPLEWPRPTMDFFQAQDQIRSVWEQRMGSADYGIGDEQQQGQGKKTATEVVQLGAVKESVATLKSRTFGDALTETLKMQWSLELQYNKADLDYFYQREYKQLDQQALKDYYQLEVNGGKDGYSREKHLQKLIQIWQTFQNSPNINQPELIKLILENVDTQLAKTLYVPSEIAQDDEMEGEANEINTMKIGFNPVVKPTENHLTRIQAIEVFKQYARQNPQAQVGPDVQIRIIQHEDAHIAALKQQNPQQYKANRPMLEKIAQDNKALVHAIAQAVKQAMRQMPQNGEQMPTAVAGGSPGGIPTGSSPGGTPVAAIEPPNGSPTPTVQPSPQRTFGL